MSNKFKPLLKAFLFFILFIEITSNLANDKKTIIPEKLVYADSRCETHWEGNNTLEFTLFYSEPKQIDDYDILVVEQSSGSNITINCQKIDKLKDKCKVRSDFFKSKEKYYAKNELNITTEDPDVEIGPFDFSNYEMMFWNEEIVYGFREIIKTAVITQNISIPIFFISLYGKVDEEAPEYPKITIDENQAVCNITKFDGFSIQCSNGTFEKGNHIVKAKDICGYEYEQQVQVVLVDEIISVSKAESSQKCGPLYPDDEILFYLDKTAEIFTKEALSEGIKLITKEKDATDESDLVCELEEEKDKIKCKSPKIIADDFIIPKVYPNIAYFDNETFTGPNSLDGFEDFLYEINPRYVRPEGKEFQLEHKYTISEYFSNDTLNLRLKFITDQMEILPIVNIGDKNLTCSQDKKEVVCNFTQEEFPLNKKDPSAKSKYEGYIINACGLKDTPILLETYIDNETVSEVKLSNFTFEGPKCEKKPSNITFTLNIKKSFNETVKDFSLLLFDEEKNEGIRCNCTVSEDSAKCINDEEIKSGVFYPKLEEAIIIKLSEDSGYFIKAFEEKSVTIIISEGDIIPLMGHQILYDQVASFNESETEKIDFVFESDLLDKKNYPTIKIENITLNCSHKSNILYCEVNKCDFPEFKTYEGHFIDQCKNELSFNFTVLEQKILRISKVNITVEDTCPSFSSGLNIILESPNLELIKTSFELTEGIYFTTIMEETIYIIDMKCQFSNKEIICTTTMNIPIKGKYTVYLPKIVNKEDYNIAPFLGHEFKYGNPNSSPINKTATPENFTHHFESKATGEFFIEYEKELNETRKVIVNETGKEVACKVEGKRINCIIDKETFPPKEEEEIKYSLIIYNACSEIEDFKMYIIVTNSKIHLEFNSLDISVEEECAFLPVEKTFSINATNIELLTTSIEIKNIIFQNKDDSNLTANTSCIVNSTNFDCKITETLPKNGIYILTLEEDEVIGSVIMKKFKSTKEINYNNISNEIEKAEDFEYDYKLGDEGHFNIEYKRDITEMPRVYITKEGKTIDFECTYKAKIMTCKFNETIMPYDEVNKTKKVEYTISIDNLCGTKARDIKAKVFKTELIAIEIKGMKLPEEKKCFPTFANRTIDLLSDQLEYVTKTEVINTFRLRHENKDALEYNVACQISKEKFFCLSNDENYESGNYKLIVTEDTKIGDNLIIHAQEINGTVPINKDEVPIKKMHDLFVYDYKFGDIAAFEIEYESNIKKVPNVYKAGGKGGDVKCTPDGRFLKCTFDRKDFSVDVGSEMNYTINIDNLCGTVSKEMPVTVRFSYNEISIVKIDYKSDEKCNVYSKKVYFDVIFKYEEGAQQRPKFNFSKVVLFKDKKIIETNSINSTNTTSTSFETVPIRIDEDGDYTVKIEETKESYYYLKEYIDTKHKIPFKRAIKPEPTTTKYEISHKYKKGENKFNFNLEFRNEFDFVYDIPKIQKVKDTERTPLTCKIDTNNKKIIVCEGTKSIFKSPNKGSTTYNFEVLDPCDVKVADGDIKVSMTAGTNKAVIIGCSVGGAVLLGVIILIVILVMKKKQKNDINSKLLEGNSLHTLVNKLDDE